jgi:hypothetical protein
MTKLDAEQMGARIGTIVFFGSLGCGIASAFLPWLDAIAAGGLIGAVVVIALVCNAFR